MGDTRLSDAVESVSTQLNSYVETVRDGEVGIELDQNHSGLLLEVAQGLSTEFYQTTNAPEVEKQALIKYVATLAVENQTGVQSIDDPIKPPTSSLH